MVNYNKVEETKDEVYKEVTYEEGFQFYMGRAHEIVKRVGKKE